MIKISLKFTPITRILVVATHHDCHPYSFSCRAIGKTPKTNTTQFLQRADHVFDNHFPVLSEKMHKRVTISDEISLICALLYIEVLKYKIANYQYITSLGKD